jgi:catechol 2,3-dioxygenase-like lactoylglutathione lyase family enzyme
MFDHVEYGVRNFEASHRFYTAVLAPLGWVVLDESVAAGIAGYGPADGPVRMLLSRVAPERDIHKLHIAFEAARHADVAAFYQAGMAAGGVDNGGPGPRPGYHPNYYAAFLLDPDGNNIEAVCRIPVTIP